MPFEFEKFPKIARWNRPTMVTEKIDGTNAQILIEPISGAYIDEKTLPSIPLAAKWDNVQNTWLGMWAGSRRRFLGEGKGEDNYGFAAWVKEHAEELFDLGPGRHFGEWWGKGILRGYGLDERRFSLFNVARWGLGESRPACCHVVPVLGEYDSMPSRENIDIVLNVLKGFGSMAAPGFSRPEGIVIYHTHSNSSFKITLENDEAGKGE